MIMRVVRLGSPWVAGEGTRIGTMRRPPRGVPKGEFASRDFYEVWFPNLAPSLETMALGQEAQTPSQWATFTKSTAPTWQRPRPAAPLSCWPPCPTRATSPRAATLRTRRTAIVPCCGSSWSKRRALTTS